MNGTGQASDPPAALRNLVYGQASLDDWAAQGAGRSDEPWRSFERARMLIRTGDSSKAVEIWRQIASAGGVSSHHALQAWYFMRQVGSMPPADVAKVVLGAGAEVPMNDSHDVLVAYQDGQANYVNYSGRTAAWEGDSDIQMRDAVSHWLAVAQVVTNAIGPWDQVSLPPLPKGHARVLTLTASGLHFGQGPMADLSTDAMASPFLSAATRVMQLIVKHVSD